MAFNKGDIVRRIHGGDYPSKSMYFDHMYTVEYDSGSEISLIEATGTWDSTYFELVTNTESYEIY